MDWVTQSEQIPGTVLAFIGLYCQRFESILNSFKGRKRKTSLKYIKQMLNVTNKYDILIFNFCCCNKIHFGSDWSVHFINPDKYHRERERESQNDMKAWWNAISKKKKKSKFSFLLVFSV